MQNILASWKTSLAGAAAILGGLADIVHQLSIGASDPTHVVADWTAITGGIGLIAAKDGNQ